MTRAVDFVDPFVGRFSLCAHTVRADRGDEFRAKFHWHAEDLGINHTYIWVRTPRLNGEAERSHGTEQLEFYQLLTYTDDVDLNEKLEEWENFYNYLRPHRSLKGKTPY